MEMPEVAEGVGMVGLELERLLVQPRCLFCVFVHLSRDERGKR